MSEYMENVLCDLGTKMDGMGWEQIFKNLITVDVQIFRRSLKKPFRRVLFGEFVFMFDI